VSHPRALESLLDAPNLADVDVEDGEDDDGEPSFRTERQTVVEEGKKVPLKADVIQYLPNQILLTVLTKVQEDAAPNPTSRKPTPIGSRRRG
jgi:hypothetical protein